MENNIRKAFRRNPKFNPFSDNFDLAEVVTEVNNYIETSLLNDPDAPGLLHTATATAKLNQLYKDIYDVLKKRITESNSTKEELMMRQIASVNRHYMILTQRQAQARQMESNFEDLFRQQIPSADPTIGGLDPGSALEGEVDALNVSLNYIKYFEPAIDVNDSREEVAYVTTTSAIAKFSVMYYVIKNCFDDISWNDGFMQFDKSSKAYKMTFSQPEHLVLDKIGFYRLQRNGQGTYLQHLNNHNPLKERFSIGSAKKKRQRIARTYTGKGVIFFGLEHGDDSYESDQELKTHSNLEAYYGFIEDVKLPSLPDLSLKDLICMFCQVQHLFRKVAENRIDDSIMKRDDFFKIPTRIKEQGLKNYLSTRTTFNTEQIAAFITLLTNKENKRIDFWNYPFLKAGDELLVPFLTINDPVIHYLIDCWLEDGGYSLDNRGKFFEDHIKEYMGKALTKHGFTYLMPNTPKFSNAAAQYEEVDLFINLKDVVLIGEVKCIKYPMGPRDHFNAYGRLENGSAQVNRKAEFIVRHAKELEPVIGDIENKQIVKVVITNYPNFTGYRINDVAVIDYYMLQSYASTGKVTSHKVTFDNGTVTNEITNAVILWDDETTFNSNLKTHLYMPQAVEQVKSLIQFTENKITLDGMDFQIYIQAAGFIPMDDQS